MGSLVEGVRVHACQKRIEEEEDDNDKRKYTVRRRPRVVLK